MFFTDKIEVARSYGEDIYPVFLNIRTPDIYNGYKELDIEKVENIISYIASQTKNLTITSLNKYVKSKPMFVNEEISKRQIEKIKFPKLKIEGDNINLNYNNTFRNFNKKESDILVKINEEE